MLNGAMKDLQKQMETTASALEEAKVTIATKDEQISKLKDPVSHMKSTAMGGRVMKRELSDIETLAPRGGARTRRVTSMK